MRASNPVVGPPGSGKSSHSFNYRNLSNVILDQQDSNAVSYQNYFRTIRETDNKRVAIEFWETDDSLPPEDKELVWKHCHGYVIMFDVTQEPTSQFEWIAAAWSCIIKLKQTRDIPCVIVGNKIDSGTRQITTETARLNVLELSSHIKYCEASKYNSGHSKEIFEDIIDMVFRKKARESAEERAREGIPQQIPSIAAIPPLPSSMTDNMKTVMNDPNYSDIEFILGDKTLYIHRLVILTRLSSVMEGIPATQKVVHVQEDIPYNIFYKIMVWIYSGEFQVEPEEADVMRTALFKWRCFPLLPFCDAHLVPDPAEKRGSLPELNVKELHQLQHVYESNDNSSTTSSRRSSFNSEDSEIARQVLRSESGSHSVFGYTPPSSGSSLSLRVPNFAMIFNETPFSDVVFNVEGKRIVAHSVFLAARSPQLKTLIANTPKTEPASPQEAKPNQPPKHELTITDWSYPAMRTLLYYIYADKLPSDIIRTETNLPLILELLGASKAFGVTTLTRLCEVILSEMIDVNNACLIYSQAVKYFTYHLKRYCAEWMSYRMQQITKSENWQKLPLSIQNDLEMMKKPGLWVEPEKKPM
eukprot:CAMPEP_0168567554 /NCGR_PEP_ID=MMETSP0413-20121227/15074_1 /TAXON_ID=136452 /ORGANISM="Filamoeba nolandi, Strain NC-AS-23-1" /LENGTH=584 /DNA_ID=CAMNT_0008599767 /DNA_START=184 /DNA_END=1936 /DNA_ORIENTATION=-